jgi:hypothetical protein
MNYDRRHIEGIKRDMQREQSLKSYHEETDRQLTKLIRVIGAIILITIILVIFKVA